MFDASAFYQEDLGIDALHAGRIAGFMKLAASSKCCQNPKPYNKHDCIRVYFDLWSQNSLPAISTFAEKFYFDAVFNDVFISGVNYKIYRKHTLKEIASTFGRSSFSGAKTRSAIKQFSEDFYVEKTNWNKCS